MKPNKQKRKRDGNRNKENNDSTTKRTRNESTKAIYGYSTWTFKAVSANNEGSQHLLLDLAFKFKYIPMDNEASGSQLASSFLLVVAGYFNGNLFIYPIAFW
ncbi:15304_t:CDS:2 [Gigaspora margarita]|uniref:15304_t:CDS:1 n=1 Tax=Gigaspora margarita TaxID=4874 RepID=A0ABM8W123_GIGMA|nr:15304_t:CDS:2 [Gigaspora margarita]